MEIVYLLENLDKKEGRRIYIGSKQGCYLEEIDGVTRIVAVKTGMPYYGSKGEGNAVVHDSGCYAVC